MSICTAADVRAYLEGYGISTSIISDTWLQARIDGEVSPYVESFTRQSFNGIQTVQEYHSGTGSDEIMLDRRDVLSITSMILISGADVTAVINIGSVDLIGDQGIIKIKSGLSEYFNFRYFPRGRDNLKITYTYGTATPPANIKEAAIQLGCIIALRHLEGKTGGGDLSVQAHSRSYGSRGKWTHIRNELAKSANYVLRQYSTAVVGQ